jgi:hypothetical protein
MPLSFEDRKRRMPIGAQQRVAVAVGVPESFVSRAMRDEVHAKRPATREKLCQVQALLAAELGEKAEDVFPEMEQEAAPSAHAS